ncbi:substrate-binding periplasmic protein [Planctobacterium marinum]|uniref:Solute-binding protein family 3/N-terminal domain-containing protein n=1 Tax=Planctobacterium marinum TaxID=1631968 RepID=A0AA48KR36_9ALTE|nr:hypothetical protein MACH26_39520 [Planctobacterium marinum]
MSILNSYWKMMVLKTVAISEALLKASVLSALLSFSFWANAAFASAQLSNSRDNSTASEDKAMPFPAAVKNVLWLTEDYPPFHYLEGNNKKGIAIDILNEIFRRNGVPFRSDKQTYVFPWARAVKEITNNTNAALLTMAYTQERDALFALSEPLFKEQIALISLADSTLTFKHINEIEDYVVGVVRDDIGERLLKDMGPDELHLVHVLSSKELVQMLIKKRVDAIAYSVDIIRYQLQQLSEVQQGLKIHMTLAELPTSIAFNKQVEPSLLRSINGAINTLKHDGTIERIMRQSDK